MLIKIEYQVQVKKCSNGDALGGLQVLISCIFRYVLRLRLELRYGIRNIQEHRSHWYAFVDGNNRIQNFRLTRT